MFPALTRAYTNAPDSLPRFMRKSFDLLLVLSVPIGLGILVVADPMVILLFGSQFAQGGPILAVMGLVLIFTYQNILLGRFLTSTDRQNAWTVVMLVATAVTVPLDILLVPWCQKMFGNGAIGGSFSFLITEIGMVVAGIRLLPRNSLGWSNVRVAVQVIFAGMVMIGVSWWFRDMVIVIPIIAGALSYTTLILLLRVVPSEDLALFKQIAQNMIRRLRQRASDSVIIRGV